MDRGREGREGRRLPRPVDRTAAVLQRRAVQHAALSLLTPPLDRCRCATLPLCSHCPRAGVLTGLLNKYLGDFIEGLDAEQLKLGSDTIRLFVLLGLLLPAAGAA